MPIIARIINPLFRTGAYLGKWLAKLLKQTFDKLTRIAAVVLAIFVVGQIADVKPTFALYSYNPSLHPTLTRFDPGDIVFYQSEAGFQKVCEMDLEPIRTETEVATYRSFSLLAGEGSPFSFLFKSAAEILRDNCAEDVIDANAARRCPLILGASVEMKGIQPNDQAFTAITVANHCIITTELRPPALSELPNLPLSTTAETFGPVKTIEITQ